MQIFHAKSEKDIAQCWEAMSFLRPHLVKAAFFANIQKMQAQGYQLIFIRESDSVVSLAGYRLIYKLNCGDIIYIDDLVTLPDHRGKGFAGLLLDYITKEAKKEGCNGIYLDSGFSRVDAHKLYINKGFHIHAFHFAKLIKHLT